MNVAYICFCPFHFEVFREVYTQLSGTKPDIVITRTGFDKDGHSVQDTIRLLEKDAIPYVTTPHRKYDVIISCHLLDKSEIRSLSHDGTQYIRILYSTIGKNYTYSDGNRLYDLILTIGDYSAERLNSYAECISVGMPRYDKLLSGGYDKKSLRFKYGLDDSRPVLVYLPTWGDQCTIEKFAVALIRLADQYHIVVKPHPLTYMCEKDKLSILENTPVKLFQEDCPIDKLMAMADLIITDYSSTIFEAAAADKPMLLLNLGKQVLEASKLYSAIDPEHQYRHIAVSVSEPEALPQAVEDALADEEPWPTLRQECTKHFFSCHDGSSAPKAAHAIEEFISRNYSRILLGRWKSRVKAVPHHVFDLYDLGLGRRLRKLIRKGKAC